MTYLPLLQKWNEQLLAAQKADLPAPPRPAPPVPTPKPPTPPDGSSATPSDLFNGMIAPLLPYAIKGVIWYQGEANVGLLPYAIKGCDLVSGEANVGNGVEYETLFPRMITDWREKWKQGDFPFLFVAIGQPPRPAKIPV